MLDRIREFIARHHMLPSGSRVGAAVSGGADSVFLLHALRTLAPALQLQLSVIHVEHGIRGQASIEDAAFVQDLARAFGLPFYSLAADVPAIDDNQEQAARRIRQQFFAGLITDGTLDRVATGHTRNDQAETVLFRILRGSGLAGIAGILPVTDEGIVRPLLEIDRVEIEAWLRESGILWREDATNQDRAYARNKLRHEILPVLRASFNRQLDEALAKMAEVACSEEAWWESFMPARDSAAVQFVRTEAITGSHPALARRLIRHALRAAKGDLLQIGFQHVERVLEMARSNEGHDRVQLPGLDVLRSFDEIRIAATGADRGRAGDFAVPLQIPGWVELPGSHARITLQILEKAAPAKSRVTIVNELDCQRLTLPGDVLPRLELRNWRPGDQYQPVGEDKPQKVKFLFQEARIPLWERGKWPIITYNETIVWAGRFGVAAQFAASAGSRSVIQIELSSEEESRAAWL